MSYQLSKIQGFCEKIHHPQYMWVAFMVIAQVSKYFYENIYITGDILCFSTAGALVSKGMIHPSHQIPSSFLPIQMIFVPIIGSLCCLSIIPPERQVQQCTRSFKVNSVDSVSSLKRGAIAISDCIFLSKAGLSYLPYYLWNGWEGGKMEAFVQPLLEVLVIIIKICINFTFLHNSSPI